MSGQSVMDRVQAARHSVLGSQIGKKVCKATTEELLAPKRKHLEDLLQYTHDSNVNVTDIVDQLLSRTHNQHWIVVYKSLITLHHLMCYGNEKVIQNMASRTMELNLANYYDRKDMQGAQMSPFIQRYSKYLSAKAGSYRAVAFDFCNAKRGKDEGKLRNMDTADLIMALPTLSDQLEALLGFQTKASDLTNGIVVASFMLLFKDCIRLFASYNEGIINLLEKFFDMTSKKQCEQALNAYKKFLDQMSKVGQFLKVAEEYGIDKGDIPDLTSAPSSLLEALEAHFNSLESDKKVGVTKKTGPQKPVGVPKQLSVNAEAFAAVTSQKPQSNNPFFFDDLETSNPALSGISEAEKEKALEEEQKELNKYSSQAKANNPFANDIESHSDSKASINDGNDKLLLDPFDGLLGGPTEVSNGHGQPLFGGGAMNDPFTSLPSTAQSNSNNISINNAFDPFGSSSSSGVSGGASNAPPLSFNSSLPPMQQSTNSNPFLQNNAAPSTTGGQIFGGGAVNSSGSFWLNGNVAAAPAQFNSSPGAFPPPAQQINFDAAFGATNSAANSSPFGNPNAFGGILQPTPVGQPSPTSGNSLFGTASGAPVPNILPMSAPNKTGNKPSPSGGAALGKDLDSALANLATSLSTKSPSHRPSSQQAAW